MGVIQEVLGKEEWQSFQKIIQKKNYGMHLKKEESMLQQVIKLVFFLQLITCIWVQKLKNVKIDLLTLKYLQ